MYKFKISCCLIGEENVLNDIEDEDGREVVKRYQLRHIFLLVVARIFSVAIYHLFDIKFYDFC